MKDTVESGKAAQKNVVWIFPIIIILAGFVVSYISSSIINEWAFVPLMLFYWTSLLLVARPTKEKLAKWFAPPKGRVYYSLLAFIPVLFCIVAFVWGLQYVRGSILIILWIIFAVVNAFAEEVFWRGYLLDHLSWKPSVSIAYSTLMFSLSHPLLWGVFSITNRSTIMVLPLLIMGLVWGFVYWKTKSLRYIVLAHFLIDILNLSVWVFLNIYVPPVI
ncbi:MAG: CPBP family intramembrane glutamic endopeptidase [Bacillota bacterium]